MAKRRAEDVLLQNSSSKRYCPSLRSVAIKEESMATKRDVSAPSLLGLLESHCRKRPCCFDYEDKLEDATPYHKTELNDTRKKAANIWTLPISNFQDRRSSCTDTNMKRPREDDFDSNKTIHTAKEKTHGDKLSEDCTYNSFQYWRVPLPELDLSLLEDSDHSQTKEKPKVGDSLSVAMET